MNKLQPALGPWHKRKMSGPGDLGRRLPNAAVENALILLIILSRLLSSDAAAMIALFHLIFSACLQSDRLVVLSIPNCWNQSQSQEG